MTAAVIDLFTRREPLRACLPELIPTAPWWTCPNWCPGDCAGGAVFAAPGGRAAYDCRLHERVIYATEASDLINDRPVAVQVRLERADAAKDARPEPTDVVLKIGAESLVRLTRQQRRQLIEALTAADALERAA
jgi:hypothetical protein